MVAKMNGFTLAREGYSFIHFKMYVRMSVKQRIYVKSSTTTNAFEMK